MTCIKMVLLIQNVIIKIIFIQCVHSDKNETQVGFINFWLVGTIIYRRN